MYTDPNRGWATVIRTGHGDLHYLMNNGMCPLGLPTYLPHEVYDMLGAEELSVYVGTYRSADGYRPQVVLAQIKPRAGPGEETFTLVFRGPRAMAIEIFEGHVGMLP